MSRDEDAAPVNGFVMSASVASSTKIKQYWDFFFCAETGTYEKSTWLDLLLAEFLVQLKEGVDPKDIITFCPTSGVVTLVGCELLCGIHRVTSSINAQYTPPAPYVQPPAQRPLDATDDREEDEVKRELGPFAARSAQSSLQILQRYLLRGTAWRCLVMLRSLGVEGLSCGRQLCSVLVWLCGELSSARAHGHNPHLPRAPPHPPVHQLFSNKIWMKQKFTTSQSFKSSPGASDRQCRAKRKVKMEQQEEQATPSKRNTENQTSDSENPSEELQVLNRSLAVKARVNNDDFLYFDSPVKSDLDEEDPSLYSDPFHTPKKHKPIPEDFINDKHRQIMDSEITPFEFHLIVIDLLQALCRAECNTCGSEGLQISVQCINFSLRNICALQFGSSPVSTVEYSQDEVSHLKAVLIELLIISLDKVLVRPDLSPKVINNGMLPMLLRLLEDVMYKLTVRLNCKSKRINDSERSQPNKEEALNIVKFIFGIGYSITAFFFCILMQCRTLEKLHDFNDQFKQYGDCQKGVLLKQCVTIILTIPEVDSEVSVMLAKKLIESVGRLVSGMKRVRSEVIHSAACPRTKHKICRDRVAAGMHHHHNILGEAGSWLGVTPACCVSVLYGVLTSLLVEDSVVSCAVLRSKLLRVMLQCGTCCCFPPAYLVENVVRLVLTHSGVVASSCLSLLENVVYGELGANILINRQPDHLPCATCERRGERRSLLNIDGEDDSPDESGPIADTLRKYYARDASSESRSSWAFLIHYNSLLQLDNHNNVLHATVSHLLRVTPKCKMEMKYDLLFGVIYPSFIVAKHRYIIRHEEAAYFLTVSCLNIFATLLSTVSFAEQFIQKGGLSYVLELVSRSEFSKQCCSIMEIAIIVEIWKLQREPKSNSTGRGSRDVGSLSSLQMMIRSLQDVTNKCYNVCKLKLPSVDFEMLADLSRERMEMGTVADQQSTLVAGNKLKRSESSSPIRIQRRSSDSEHTVEQSIEDHVEVLKNGCTFWKSCAGLCLYSPCFRKYIVSESIFLESYGMLKILFFYVCKCLCSAAETRVLIKILESLLTIQFAVSDVTMNKSKEITMEILHEVFLSDTVLSSDGAALKAVCEMLIRVATSSASPVQVMPPVNKAKLPPLLCASVSSELESSSDGDEDNSETLAGPYMSEASEPYQTADDGYEADVELGKGELLATRYSTYNSGKPSDVNFNSSGDTIVLECSEYTKSGVVTHPELCVMVVDILSQLIDKLLLTREGVAEDAAEAHEASVGAVGVALARACCARLAAALARAPSAPPPAATAATAAPPAGDVTIVGRLLTGTAAHLLTHTAPELEELQRSILELVHVLASQSVLPAELAAYLRLFTARRPPLDTLLAALARLLPAAQTNMPDFILSFPIQRYTSADEGSNETAASESGHLYSVASQSHQAELTASRLNDEHLQAGVRSPWSCWALRCGVEGAGWGLWAQGFAATLWLRPQDARAPPASADSSYSRADSAADSMSEWGIIEEWRDLAECPDRGKQTSPGKKGVTPVVHRALHLLSVGHESLVLESWLHVRTGAITFKLSRPDSRSNKVLSETTIESNIPSHQWNFIAFNVREIVQKRKIHIQITLFVNGHECETAILPLQGILVRKAIPTSVLVGHSLTASSGASSAVDGVYHLSGLSLFRAPLLTGCNVLYVMAHGPNVTVLSGCQVGCPSPNFASVITPEVLASNIDWDQVYDMSPNNLGDLQDNLLLTFSAQSPTIMNLYHQTSSLPTVFSGRGAAGAAGGGGAGGAAAIPETLLAVWSGAALPGRYRGAPPAVFMLGGPDVFLYLFARVVELGGSAEQQALALSMPLRLCAADARLHSAFIEEGGLCMLHTVLASARCRVTHHLLKALLDAACSKSVLTESNGRFYVMTRSDAILLEPLILVTALAAWRELEGSPSDSETGEPGEPDVHYPPSAWMYERSESRHDASGGVLGTLLLSMHALLRDDHPQRTFNAYQMNRVGLMRHLLLFCKERFLDSAQRPLSDSVSVSLVELVRALPGEPLALCHLALITDFLLLMHQASETFVTHSRSNFYFLLTSESQSVSESTLQTLTMPYVAKRKSKKSHRRRKQESDWSVDDAALLMKEMSVTKSSVSTFISQNSEDVMNDNSANVLKERAQGADNSSLSSCGGNANFLGHPSDAENRTVDSVKHNKSLINMQIKHNSLQRSRRSRRSKRSSASINESNTTQDHSEVALEDSGGSVPPIEQQILANEYVVIDSDEVDKSTVQMFSSGIFHQTRVRAGAAPGWAVCEGLLLLLRDTICVMPDTMLNQVLGVVVQTECLLVLGNHKEASVRAGVVRVVCALAQRCSADDARRLEGSLYFYHLANQISLYPASYDLLAAAATLLTKCDASLEEQLEDSVWAEVNEKWLARAPPLLALLPCTLHDIPLAHNVILIVKKIIDKASLKLICELGLCEVVVRCLRIVGAISDASFEGRELLLEDLRGLLIRVALKALASQHNMQIISDIQHQLSYVEIMEAAQEHAERRACHVVSVVRDTQCALYDGQLQCLEERLSSWYVAHPNTANYFATVLTSAVVSMAPDGSSTNTGLSKSELASRHRSVLIKAVNFIITRDPYHMITPAEISLVERLFINLVNAVTGSSPGPRPKWWATLSGGDWLSTLQQLFQWLLSPLTYCELLKAFALRYIYQAPAQLQQLLTPSDPQGQRKLAVYLLSILKLLHANPSPLVETTITDWARNWALQTQAQLADRVDSNTLADEARHFAAADQEMFGRLATPHTSINKSIFNKDSLANKLAESAMAITRQVVDVQNTERKSFMEHLRRCQSETVAATQKWQKLVDKYTHEHALWYMEESYPTSWELDPTEGPGRVRVRLQRCHLNIDKKFFKEGRAVKAEETEPRAPLSFLFESPHSVMHNGLLERLHLNESVHHMSRVTYVTVSSDQPGDLLLSDRCIHFVAESELGGGGAGGGAAPGALSWSLEEVTSVVARRWCLRERAVELFLGGGRAHLVAFHTADEMNAFLKALNSMRLPNRSESETLTEAMNLWRNGTLTNWEYLMRLNGWGGRSYNDLMQYPVLPFVLADYTSKVLDLTAPASFRDLRKPMAVQDRKNETHYVNNYNYLKQARREGSCLISGVNREPYHYGSHYSNSGTVLHFLVRLPPFTRLFLNYQDNNFDIPDRTFHSLQTTWRLTSCDSTTDVKELIPEFFYLPEFLHNSEMLNLGVRQCGVAVDDVELPPWAVNSRLFTLIHRQALESSIATENLPYWIDLVFGYKQTGQAAVDAINVFHPATYYGFEPSSITDSVERSAWETMVRTYGQTPRQLLRHPHPHATTDLYNIPNNTMAVSCVVEGARWGAYCGSPACPAPVLLLTRPAPYVQRLSVLSAPRAVAATTRASLVLALPAHTRNRAVAGAAGGAAPYAMALLTWGHSDGMVRLKQRKELPPEILMQVPGIDSITTASTSCLRGGCAVWLGHASGRLLVLRPRAPPAPRPFRARPLELRAHSHPVVDVYVCTAFGVAVTASCDGLIVVWDLNKLSYVRAIPNSDKLPVVAVCVSETLCDIASVHPAGGGDGASDATAKPRGRHRSLLRVHTVNGRPVGTVKVLEKVTCVCYSTAPEGVSVNSIAAGLETGGVRLYSSWDLRPLTYIAAPATSAGLVSITYSVDSQQLFAATAEGTVLVWESGGATRSNNIRILSSLAIF